MTCLWGEEIVNKTKPALSYLYLISVMHKGSGLSALYLINDDHYKRKCSFTAVVFKHANKEVTESISALPSPLPFPAQEQVIISVIGRKILGQILQWFASALLYAEPQLVGEITPVVQREHMEHPGSGWTVTPL